MLPHAEIRLDDHQEDAPFFDILIKLSDSTLFKIVASIVILAGLSMLVEFKTSGRKLKTKENSEDDKKATKSSLSGKEKELAVYLFLFFVLCVGSGRI